MSRTNFKLTISTLLIFFFPSFIFAQAFSETGINLGAKLGVSRMLGEIPKGSFQIINEFDHHLGITSSAEIGKDISSHIQLGVDFGISVLNGNSYTPIFSAEGIHFSIPDDIIDPVEYRNILTNISISGRYFLKQIGSQSAVNPFIGAGGGFLNYHSTLRYIDSGETIFGKGKGNSTKLSTSVLIISTGFKTYLNKRNYLMTSVDFNFMGYDFLDVMHNYEVTGERMKVNGLFTELKIGFFFNTGNSGKSSGSSSIKKKKGASKSDVNLPFAR